MPRIPDEEIARIKRETDLLALVRSRGVELGKHGAKDWSGRCPFDEDDKPSFIVSPDKGLYHCLGCGAAGNAIQFVEKFDGVSFRHAFEFLSSRPFSARAWASQAVPGNATASVSSAVDICRQSCARFSRPISPHIR